MQAAMAERLARGGRYKKLKATPGTRTTPAGPHAVLNYILVFATLLPYLVAGVPVDIPSLLPRLFCRSAAPHLRRCSPPPTFNIAGLVHRSRIFGAIAVSTQSGSLCTFSERGYVDRISVARHTQRCTPTDATLSAFRPPGTRNLQYPAQHT
jgi:hypothetical protein